MAALGPRLTQQAATAVEIWEESVVVGAFPMVRFGLSDADQLRLFLAGKIGPPPDPMPLRVRPTEIGVDNATFTMPITDWLRTPQGQITDGAV